MATIGTASDESDDEYLIFTWGANSYGQLGINHTTDLMRPSFVQFSESKQKIVQVDGGGGHSVFLLDGGGLLSCGWNKHCQAGLPQSHEKVIVPTVLPNCPCAKKVSCGWNHTLIITDAGAIAVCGSNSHGQLGLPHVQCHSSCIQPISSKVFCENKVVDVACGLRHSAAATDTGTVYTWGSGKKGQLGHGEMGVAHSTHIRTPKIVEKLQGVLCTKVSAMAYNTAVRTVDGSLFLWGCNSYGQCTAGLDEGVASDVHVNELGLVTAVLVPIKVKMPPIVQVCCGWSHVFAITAERRVFAWGRCDYGQLGIDVPDKKSRYVSVPTEVAVLKGAKEIVCGSEHSIAISGDNELLSWGWNEHGMCGTGDQDNRATPTKISLTPPPNDQIALSVPVLIGAGAGHSIIVAMTTNV